MTADLPPLDAWRPDHPVAPRTKVVHVVEWVTPERSAQ